MVVAAILMILLYIAIVVFMIAAMWKIFTKAGQPGWACIIPIYNYVIMLKIARKPMWWLAILLLVPFVNIIFLIMTIHAISVNFGKDAGFTVGLILLPIIFFPILAFGSAKYIPGPETVPQA